MGRSATRRFISAILLLGFCLAFMAPVFALYAAQSARMACCKRGPGACCRMHARQRTETGFAAAPHCPDQCSIGSVSPQSGDSLAASPLLRETEFASCSPARVNEEIHSYATFYPAFLYQLPPPTTAR